MQTEAKAVENRKSLVRVPVGKTARVARLDTDESIRARLLDMGFTRGAAATCLFESPGGDPRAYLIRGAVVALRGRDAATILVEETENP
ncbi:MAG TPA: ferrous iron transport protein A [Candidatus Avichristensenella intestinipullorum]|uniref:Ferrous iron transport protein A n=1 Tax=Candidatus Avichristensenella intestinipullorum TaxID=2840693 RepID=A0A9D0YWB4_9FIRM|nr:ferrous iron transport protein A [Candidatus Avichristensenella intestinipullorum]